LAASSTDCLSGGHNLAFGAELILKIGTGMSPTLLVEPRRARAVTSYGPNRDPRQDSPHLSAPQELYRPKTWERDEHQRLAPLLRTEQLGRQAAILFHRVNPMFLIQFN
jgi:hypothetical protein